jgi:hypothetical protein
MIDCCEAGFRQGELRAMSKRRLHIERLNKKEGAIFRVGLCKGGLKKPFTPKFTNDFGCIHPTEVQLKQFKLDGPAGFGFTELTDEPKNPVTWRNRVGHQIFSNARAAICRANTRSGMRITSVSPSSAHAMPPDFVAAVMARLREPAGRPRFALGRVAAAVPARFAFRAQ